MSCCAEHQLVSSGSSYIATMWANSPYLTAALFGPLVLALLLLYPALVFLTPKEKILAPSAFAYSTSNDAEGVTHSLPKLVEIDANDDAVQLSIVIPAFNEVERLPIMLDEAIKHLNMLREQGKNLEGTIATKKSNGSADTHTVSAAQQAMEASLKSYEILVVDDGSKDATASDALKYAKENGLEDTLRLIKLGQNCGKGKAVRHGVLHARGALIAFCDADGATRFSDLSNLAKELERIITPSGYGIVCGSRAHLVGTAATVKRSFVRNFLMHSFHLILSLLMRPPNPIAALRSSLPSFLTTTKKSTTSTRQRLPAQPAIRDTQCGFKLFTRRSAQAVFPLAHIDRWIFDVELLLLAELASHATLRQTAAIAADEKHTHVEQSNDPLLQLPLPISEVAVDWREVEGSKIDILKDSIKMGLDLIIIRLNYALGRWKTPGVLPTVENGLDKTACCK